MTMPPLPEPVDVAPFNHMRVYAFTNDQMQAYGAACAAAAVKAEREECATLCDEKHALRSADGFPREASTARALAAYRELPAPYARATLQQRYRAPQPDTYTLEQAHQILRSEQERCAKICELIEAEAWALWKTTADPIEQGRNLGAQHCADAIRKQEL